MRVARSRLGRVSASLALFVLATGAVVAASRLSGGAREGATVAVRGARIPRLEVVDEAGAVTTLAAELQRLPTVVVFHSPECGVCQLMLPALQPFPATLQLVMVDVSGNTRPRGQVPALGPRNLTADKATVQRLFPFSGLPTIVFLDSLAVIREGLAGDQPKGTIQTALQSFAAARR